MFTQQRIFQFNSWLSFQRKQRLYGARASVVQMLSINELDGLTFYVYDDVNDTKTEWFDNTFLRFYHFAPGRGAKYCDELAMSVCLSVDCGRRVCLYLFTRITRKLRGGTSPTFFMNVACSSRGARSS